MKYKSLNDEIEKATECLKRGGEITWTVDGITHYHSLKNPHDFLPYGCSGQCREKSITGKKNDQ